MTELKRISLKQLTVAGNKIDRLINDLVSPERRMWMR